MRTIEPVAQFRRDFKREKKGQHRATLDDDFGTVVEALLRLTYHWSRATVTMYWPATGKITVTVTSSPTWC